MRREKSEVGTSESSEWVEWVEWENESFRGPERDPERPLGLWKEGSVPAGGMGKKRSVPHDERWRRAHGLRKGFLNIRGCHEDGRQLESLHFYSVP